jgi:hypothetical protein
MVSHEAESELRNGLWFSIEIDEEEFVAFVTAEALDEHFNASKNKESRRTAYRQNQKTIDLVARRKFFSGFPRPINLDVADFPLQG